jgi:hypothetical protein
LACTFRRCPIAYWKPDTKESVGVKEGPAFILPHPLLVPELVSMVLHNLDNDKRSLSSAILVHPTWTLHATPLLWPSVDLDKAFAGISGAWRQLYAKKVYRLTVVASSKEIFVDYPPLSFPRLQALHIDARTKQQLNS